MKVDFSLLVLPANHKQKMQDINWEFQQFSSIVQKILTEPWQVF